MHVSTPKAGHSRMKKQQVLDLFESHGLKPRVETFRKKSKSPHRLWNPWKVKADMGSHSLTVIRGEHVNHFYLDNYRIPVESFEDFETVLDMFVRII